MNEKVLERSTATFKSLTISYSLITKPGIIMGNAITTVGGFALASKNHFNFWLLLAAIAGLSLIIASACVFNNCIDREHDEKMARTKDRALALKLITNRRAIIFATLLVIFGTFILTVYVNFLAVAIALFGFFVYVILYSFLKYRSVHATLIGSIAGSVPPVVGYCAATNHFDIGAFVLFIMMAIWQMPHFFAIAIYRLEDYAKASIPVLPLIKSIFITKIQMLLYIAAYIIISSMLTLLNYSGYAFLITAALMGISWLFLCMKGFTCKNDRSWARKMFFFSLIVIISTSGLLLLNPFLF